MSRIKLLSGGLSNTLYLLDDKVIIRIYGTARDGLIDGNSELLIMKQLGTIAPQILLEFTGGRIEEYIDNARHFTIEDLSNHILKQQLVLKLRELHNTGIDQLDKEPLLIKYISDWTTKAQQCNASSEFSELFAMKDILISQLTILKQYPPGIALCHNDLQKNNILVKNDEVKLIDFEYSGYNFVGFEIANFLCELSFKLHDDRFEYEAVNETVYKDICNEYANDPVKGAELYNSIDFFTICSHYVWIMWSIIKANCEKNNFDYIAYAMKRLDLLRASSGFHSFRDVLG